MLETVAIMGPARFGVPFTQGLSAPLLGRLHARGWGAVAQFGVCFVIRMLSNAAGLAFFVWVIAGGVDAYAGTYDAIAERLGFSLSEQATLILSLVGLGVWAPSRAPCRSRSTAAVSGTGRRRRTTRRPACRRPWSCTAGASIRAW